MRKKVDYVKEIDSITKFFFKLQAQMASMMKSIKHLRKE